MFCKRCGTRIDDNAVKCQGCGFILKEEITPEPIESTTNNNAANKSDLGTRIFWAIVAVIVVSVLFG